MKTKIIFILLCFLSLNVMGQGVITRNKKPKTTQTQPTKTHRQEAQGKLKTKTASKPKAEKTCDLCGKVLSKCEYNGNHPEPEAAGYDVTFSCNVSSATLYIDGEAYNNASCTRFLKTGNHSVRVTAEGYKDYEGNINVSSQNKSCSIALEKNPNSYKNGILSVNNISYKMVYVESGTFQMGGMHNSYEKPVHSVTLSSYYIGETEVTQELWEAVMGSNPSRFKGSSNPVEKVSWNDCQEFISKLNSLTGQKFRLPTEAEWEYAARGGSKSRGYRFSGSNALDDVAWYDADNPHPVKTKQPNELGIYDMTGNVWEWCQDWYGSYSSDSQTNPTGPTTGAFHVFRGGGWYGMERELRVANRLSKDGVMFLKDYHAKKPNYRNNIEFCSHIIGFRLAISE